MADPAAPGQPLPPSPRWSPVEHVAGPLVGATELGAHPEAGLQPELVQMAFEELEVSLVELAQD